MSPLLVAGYGWQGLKTDNMVLMAGGVASAIFSMAAASWCCTLAAEMKGTQRALVFLREGTTRAPFGLAAGRWQRDECRLPHADIVSIDARESADLSHPLSTLEVWRVEVLYGSGHIVTVADNLTKGQAERLAVTLTTALKDLRECGGQASQQMRKNEHAERVSE